MSVVAAMVWTYWMAFPILAVTLLTLIAFGAWYLKKVVEPRLLRSDLSQVAAIAETPETPTAPPGPAHQVRRPDPRVDRAIAA